MIGIVEHQFDAAAAGGLARSGAVEDHVLHRFAAQLAGLAFTQHPAHGIDDVGFAAAIGPDHANPLARQRNTGRLGKRLEPGKFDGSQAHGNSGTNNNPGATADGTASSSAGRT